MMRDFLKKLLTGSAKVIGQKVDKKLKIGVLLCLITAERKNVIIYRTQSLALQNL